MSAWYNIEGEDERYECDCAWTESEHGTALAEMCAEYCHGRRDGWGLSYPITLTLYESENGPAIGRYVVERIDVPRFYATEA